ncbi:MAG: hypothetical protein CO144_00340 [Candidatus Nealsonbacteria bacterium CG_4_9_14_3_um_filter_35_11]|uniref:ParB-like N-terminal domain-containing protein n=1 Tax=Candidatus Nealsonbacteria bacterium CG11_big_fil_rev_8_21_14_0_20_35_11 TaxID=1974713 RepID=A0A2H0MZG3_9BACT|nr:MAG: hypothetical protein COV62_02535 [Candidatus Nealsonbacteria bacterium CG11_big_fil_rev_8_21_14_0_20_35_11]PIZ89855.1 MAG: hypothetical protein COX88_01595 [Candidatus Nealsonbacteria bacterium CG_4_10_14_0_2_um_filter_35_20]PJA84825.1 MAG: hypothetical protein CO144_00340 [Candidatus Nealsonbacteria bacterium CG_4_9_14_3_um_filter_35_11]
MLGKGLESLIPKKEKETSLKSKKEAIFWIETKKIKPNPYQPRKDINQTSLQSLADSIKKYGILQPLIVTKTEKKDEQGLSSEYQIVAGERRLRASKMIGLSEVPVIIKEPTEREKLEVSLIENIQRENLNPIEKAEAFKRLHQEFGLFQREIAEITGTGREAVANSLRLLSLPEAIKKSLGTGEITEGHARALLMVKNTREQQRLFSEILENKLSVRETEKMAQGVEKLTPQKMVSEGLSLKLKTIKQKLKEVLRLDTLQVKKGPSNFRVTIFFKSEKEINDWLKNLKN